MLPTTPGLVLRRVRERAGVTAASCAKAAGVSRALYSLIEHDKRRAYRASGRFDLEALARLLRVDGEELGALLEAAESDRLGMPGVTRRRDALMVWV